MARAKAFRIRRAANDDGPRHDDPGPASHKVALSLLRREGPDLSSRQLGVFLAIYLDEGQHTVRGLATLFHVCKPAIRRALDRLGELDLARRALDPRDRRNVLVHRTDLGWAFLHELRRAVGRAADDAESAEASRAAARPRRGPAAAAAAPPN